jgi:hypothetical protein
MRAVDVYNTIECLNSLIKILLVVLNLVIFNTKNDPDCTGKEDEI